VTPIFLNQASINFNHIKTFSNFKIKRITFLFFYAISASFHLKNIFKIKRITFLFFYAISASYPLKNFFQTLKSTKTNHSVFYPELHDFDPIRVCRQNTLSFQINKITKTFSFFIFTLRPYLQASNILAQDK